jgi:hypothetical protein
MVLVLQTKENSYSPNSNTPKNYADVWSAALVWALKTDDASNRVTFTIYREKNIYIYMEAKCALDAKRRFWLWNKRRDGRKPNRHEECLFAEVVEMSIYKRTTSETTQRRPRWRHDDDDDDDDPERIEYIESVFFFLFIFFFVSCCST